MADAMSQCRGHCGGRCGLTCAVPPSLNVAIKQIAQSDSVEIDVNTYLMAYLHRRAYLFQRCMQTYAGGLPFPPTFPSSLDLRLSFRQKLPLQASCLVPVFAFSNKAHTSSQEPYKNGFQHVPREYFVCCGR